MQKKNGWVAGNKNFKTQQQIRLHHQADLTKNGKSLLHQSSVLPASSGTAE